MHPVILIIGLVLCTLGMIAASIIAMDGWSRGRRGFAAFWLLLALVSLSMATRTMDAIDQAYLERTQ